MKKTLFVILFVFITGIGIGIYQYNKPHRNISKAESEYKYTASELYRIFQKDENAANKTYHDKVIQVTGNISEKHIDQNGKTMFLFKDPNQDFGVSCTFDQDENAKLTKIHKGDKVKVKGICTGGGQMMDVVLLSCKIID
jgi:Cu/Ag efflux protein CusF